MTIAQAKKAVAESFKNLVYIKPGGEDVKFSREKLVFKLKHGGSTVYDGFLVFDEIGELSVRSGELVETNGKPLRLGTFTNNITSCAIFGDRATAMRFVDALLTLKAAGTRPSEKTDLAVFTVNAQTWLAQTIRPEMPDDARAYRLLAEEAFKRKDLAGALEAYGVALGKFPLWPEGHYNAALLAGEAEDYELAAHHMRRYLVLAPEAQDASPAKDKLLLWQLKASK
jgi:tetratricopeptide (TPR) repeat protein